LWSTKGDGNDIKFYDTKETKKVISVHGTIDTRNK
jgi:hypothetical protein